MKKRIALLITAAIMALSMTVGPVGGAAFADAKKNPKDPACVKDRGGDNKNCPGKRR